MRARLVVIPLALVLVGCSGGSQTPGASGTAPASGEVSASPGAAPSASGPSTAASTDPSPAASPASADPSPPQDGAFLDRSNEDELTREWWVARAACYTEQGFPAVVLPDGEGLEIQSGGAAQREAYRAAGEECDRRLGETPAPDYTEAEWGALYELYTGPVTECLQDNGFQVPEPPSQQVWVEEYMALVSGPGGLVDSTPWSPYDALLHDPNAGMKAQELCPHPGGQEIYEHLTGQG